MGEFKKSWSLFLRLTQGDLRPNTFEPRPTVVFKQAEHRAILFFKKRKEREEEQHNLFSSRAGRGLGYGLDPARPAPAKVDNTSKMQATDEILTTSDSKSPVKFDMSQHPSQITPPGGWSRDHARVVIGGRPTPSAEEQRREDERTKAEMRELLMEVIHLKLFNIFILVPSMSRHLSSKDIFPMSRYLPYVQKKFPDVPPPP